MSPRIETKSPARHGPGVKAAPTASPEALRAVAVVLQVLGGALTPAQAAAAPDGHGRGAAHPRAGARTPSE